MEKIANPNVTLTGQVCGEGMARTHAWRHRQLVHPSVVGPAILSRHVLVWPVCIAIRWTMYMAGFPCKANKVNAPHTDLRSGWRAKQNFMQDINEWCVTCQQRRPTRWLVVKTSFVAGQRIGKNVHAHSFQCCRPAKPVFNQLQGVCKFSYSYWPWLCITSSFYTESSQLRRNWATTCALQLWRPYKNTSLILTFCTK